MNGINRSEAESEGLCEWAIYMLGSREWRGPRGSKERVMREKVLGECMTELGRWNLRLAEGVVGSMGGEGELWRAVLDAGRSEVEGESTIVIEKAEEKKEAEEDMEVDVEIEKTVEAVPSETAVQVKAPEPVEVKEKITGPQKVVGLWKPKPIGWLPDGWDEDA